MFHNLGIKKKDFSYKVLHVTVLGHPASDRPAEVVEGKGSIRLLLHQLLEAVEPEPADALAH